MLQPKKILPSDIEKHFAALSKIGHLGASLTDGFLRASWSPEETEAMEYVKKQGIALGLMPKMDGIGNLFLRTPGNQAEVVQIGSHLDTVPRGGLYDGGVGVVAGFEAIKALRDFWITTKRALELVIWRGEESATFNVGCKGSQAAFGINDPSALDRSFSNATLDEAIEKAGYSADFIRERRPTLTKPEIDSIFASLEIHIEQASKLEIDKRDIGIVTSVRGSVRYRIVVRGESAHSGGTPPGATYRKDANLAIAHMQVAFDQAQQKYLDAGKDIVHTVGVVNSDKDFNDKNPTLFETAQTKVSHFGYFLLDVRSDQASVLESYCAEAMQLTEDISKRLNVQVTIEKITSLRPLENLDSRIQKVIEAACVTLQYSSTRLPSGGYHDVAVVAQQKRSDGTSIPAGLIFIPCLKGVSHNPAEYATNEDIAKSANVAALVLAELATL